VIPLRPEQNIIAAVDRDDVIDNLCRNVEAQLLAINAQRIALKVLSAVLFPCSRVTTGATVAASGILRPPHFPLMLIAFTRLHTLVASRLSATA
jgi:hypothetical protein